ncbi:O-antigen ligase family protein [Isoptericola sp. NPDC055881]
MSGAPGGLVGVVRTRPHGPWLILTVLVLAAAVGLLTGLAAPAGIAAAVLVLLLGLTAYEPLAVPLMVLPAVTMVVRVGGGGVDLSLSDFALFGAFWFALLLGPRPYSRPMRTLLWLSALYQATTLFTVLVNPYQANVVEWVHAWFLVGGALVVGWAIGRSGRGGLGLTLVLVPCLVIAALTLLFGGMHFLQGDTGPVYLSWPYGMHKNFIGTLLAFAAAIVYARPPWLGWPSWVSHASFGALAVAVAATQARQAYVSLGVAIVVILLRPGQGVRHSRWILAPVVVACVAVLTLVKEQVAEGNVYNSTFQRLTWFQQALEVWHQNPWAGVGLRWWTTGQYYQFQPPNAELEVLSSAGIIGLVGFLALQLGGLVALWRVRPDYGTVAFAVIASRFVQGQLDLFWVAVSVSVPYLIAGLCLGAAAHADAAEGRVEGPLRRVVAARPAVDHLVPATTTGAAR